MRSSPTGLIFLVAISYFFAVASSQADDLAPFGQFVNPDGDCRAVVDGKSISLFVPGSHHDLTYTDRYSKINAPRVTQKVSGDFTIEVLVEPFRVPGDTPSSGGDFSFVSGGLLIWVDDNEFVRLESAAVDQQTFVWLERFQNGKSAAQQIAAISATPTRLYIARKSDTLSFSFQAGMDGPKTSISLPSFQLPNELQAGIAAINSTTREHTVKFSDFHIAP
jgi:regulation of enolase protein 1 (concanavalin A-like superfamily)